MIKDIGNATPSIIKCGNRPNIKDIIRSKNRIINSLRVRSLDNIINLLVPSDTLLALALP